MPASPLARDLLATAEKLVEAADTRPRQADLRRAVSTAYYALFHCLCFNCANCIIGRTDEYPRRAWQQTYRALNHGFAKEACNRRNGQMNIILQRFPIAIQEFADSFYDMQIKRHQADYDPFHKLTKSEVRMDLNSVKSAISAFEKVALADRKAFTALVLFPIKK